MTDPASSGTPSSDRKPRKHSSGSDSAKGSKFTWSENVAATASCIVVIRCLANRVSRSLALADHHTEEVPVRLRVPQRRSSRR